MLRDNIEQLLKAERFETRPQDVLSFACDFNRVEHGWCPPPSSSSWLADARSPCPCKRLQSKRLFDAYPEMLVTLSFVRDHLGER